jgi:hypothetical protein
MKSERFNRDESKGLGLDENGKGAVYGYDAVGSYKRDDYGAMGSGQNFVIPLLDNLIGHKNRRDEKIWHDRSFHRGRFSHCHHEPYQS